MIANLLFIHALSSLHPGTGQGVGVIDLPVAREVATGIPYLPGSSLKGVLREQCTDEATRNDVFGPDARTIANDSARAGSAVFSDQRLLLLPARSLAGTFAWVTSPFILNRFARDCMVMGVQTPGTVSLDDPKKGLVVKGTSLRSVGDVVILEDLDLVTALSKPARLWASWLQELLFPGDETWQTMFSQRFCIVHDDVMSFLLDTATEITARNVLDEKKTSGNLWYVESLPAESILYGMVAAQQVGKEGLAPDEVLTKVGDLTAGPVQLGGNASVGRGLCRLKLATPDAANALSAATKDDTDDQ